METEDQQDTPGSISTWKSKALLFAPTAPDALKKKGRRRKYSAPFSSAFSRSPLSKNRPKHYYFLAKAALIPL